jgi:hypothetical protein
MIDGNVAIMVPSFWLKVGGNGLKVGGNDRYQPWKDSLETISWQAFEQEDGLISFRAMKQQSFLTMRLLQAESTILLRGSKGGEIHRRGNLVQNLARKRNHNKEPSQGGFDGGYEITSRCIAFRSPVASRYTQSNSITSEQEKFDNDINSVLTASNSQ